MGPVLDVYDDDFHFFIYAKILSEMCLLSLMYGYVAVCRFCAVHCVIIICFSLLFSNYWSYFILTLFCVSFRTLYISSLFCIFCVIELLHVLFLLLYIAVPFLHDVEFFLRS